MVRAWLSIDVLVFDKYLSELPDTHWEQQGTNTSTNIQSFTIAVLNIAVGCKLR